MSGVSADAYETTAAVVLRRNGAWFVQYFEVDENAMDLGEIFDCASSLRGAKALARAQVEEAATVVGPYRWEHVDEFTWYLHGWLKPYEAEEDGNDDGD